MQKHPAITQRDRNKEDKDVMFDDLGDISALSTDSSPTHYSHLSFVSLADFYPTNPSPVDRNESTTGGRGDSGLNSILVKTLTLLTLYLTQVRLNSS